MWIFVYLNLYLSSTVYDIEVFKFMKVWIKLTKLSIPLRFGKLVPAICRGGGGNSALRSVKGGEAGGWLLGRTRVSLLGLHGADKT